MQFRKKKITILNIAAVALVLAATLSSILAVYPVSAQQETKASIVSGASTMGDKSFSPNPINVKVGDTVTWTNNDGQAHTITSGTGPNDPNKGKDFNSSPGFNPLLVPGKTFSHKFTKVGEFPYFCQLHPSSVGKVVVSS